MPTYDLSRRPAASRAKDFTLDEVKAMLLSRAEAVCKDLFPMGRVRGREFVIGGLDGGKGQSMSINLKSGVWKDFAKGDAGSNLLELWRANLGTADINTAKEDALEWLGEKSKTERMSGKITSIRVGSQASVMVYASDSWILNSIAWVYVRVASILSYAY